MLSDLTLPVAFPLSLALSDFGIIGGECCVASVVIFIGLNILTQDRAARIPVVVSCS